MDDKQAAKPKRCRWKRNYLWGRHVIHTAWTTQCNEQQIVYEDDLHNTRMKYCPYCGAELVTEE